MIYQHEDVRVHLRKNGSDQYTKVSYPLRYGLYSEVETKDAILQFNLNHEIVYAKGKGPGWPDPQEWLKRTCGNDWIYYSTGGYTGVFEAIGEYYLPNTPYPTNSLIGGNPFSLPPVARLTESWHTLLGEIADRANGVPENIQDFLTAALANSPETLQKKADSLFKISGGRTTVLPPDARHVDYNVIPLTIAEGCLYKCRFCRVKTESPFREKSSQEIDGYIDRLSELYRDNLANYNSLFLGQHDALCVRRDLLVESVEKACRVFGFPGSYMKGTNIFLFGSVDSLLDASSRLFEDLQKFPYAFYINIGLESGDQETLDRLGKPVTSAKIAEAFARMQDINDRYLNIEVTANFIMDETLPKNHYPAFLKLVRDGLTRNKPKGCIYLSPLRIGRPSRSILFEFNRLKVLSRLPTFLYIIQRL